MSGAGPSTGRPAATQGAGPGANRPFSVAGKVIVVTGGASGIGAALGRRFHADGARAVVLVDLDAGRAAAVAARFATEDDGPAGTEGGAGSDSPAGTRPSGGIEGGRIEGGTTEGDRIEGIGLDVSDATATVAAIDAIEQRHGPIDLFCANAGIGTGLGAEAPPQAWQRMWEVNVMAHVHAAQALLPRWQARGGGHLLVTASAAGLLTNLGDAPYSVTKHAAVAFAEWVAITHGADGAGQGGIGVSCLCPQGVRTPLLFGAAADDHAELSAQPGTTADSAADFEGSLAARVVTDQRILEPDQVAEAVVVGLAEGRFLILPHAEVAGYEQVRAADHDRWIRSMRKLQARLGAG